MARSRQPTCPISAALDVVGEWWSLLVVREAFHGVQRFDALQARLGIARNILARRLSTLVEHGVLERRRYQEHPPRFEYALTEKGQALYPVIVSLFTWGSRWEPHAQPAALIEVASGRAVEPVLVDRQTGAAVEPGKVRMQRTEPSEPPPARPGARRRARAPREGG